MPCFYPLEGYRSDDGGITFSPKTSMKDTPGGRPSGFPLSVPCGHCIGCRKNKAREWAIRLEHEARMYRDSGLGSSMITLTYEDKWMPIGIENPDPIDEQASRPSLRARHISGFMKALRKQIDAECIRNGEKAPPIRYYIAGEYGESTARPHYHGIIFGWSFPDREPLSVRGNSGKTLYRSPLLARAWRVGYHSIGADMAPEAIGYVTKYITKGPSRQALYLQQTEDGHVIRDQEPMRALMSRRPGLGKTYFEAYWEDMYPSDEVVNSAGKVVGKPPRYYDKLLEEAQPEIYAEVKRNRLRIAREETEKFHAECEENPWRKAQKEEHAIRTAGKRDQI